MRELEVKVVGLGWRRLETQRCPQSEAAGKARARRFWRGFMVTELRGSSPFRMKSRISLHSVVSLVTFRKLWLHPVHIDHA